MKLSRKSKYVKDLIWFEPVNCGICERAINLSIPSGLININNVLTIHPLSFSEDHIFPRILGGKDLIENIQPAHFYCNNVKSSNLMISESKKNSLFKIIDSLIEDPKLIISKTNYINCLTCNILFYAQNARIVKYNRKYCSVKCQNKGLSNRIKLKCNFCKEDFLETPSRILGKRGKFCSKKCYSASSGGVKKICKNCSNVYYISENNKRVKVNLYCSTCRKIV